MEDKRKVGPPVPLRKSLTEADLAILKPQKKKHSLSSFFNSSAKYSFRNKDEKHNKRFSLSSNAHQHRSTRTGSMLFNEATVATMAIGVPFLAMVSMKCMGKLPQGIPL